MDTNKNPKEYLEKEIDMNLKRKLVSEDNEEYKDYQVPRERKNASKKFPQMDERYSRNDYKTPKNTKRVSMMI